MQVQELVGIVPWTFIAQICNLFLQVYLIKRFLFKPINNMLAKRKELADAQIQEAVKAKEEAETMKSEYEQGIRDARNKANEIVAAAQKTAAVQSEELLKEAASQDEIGGMAMEIAGKVIEREISEEDHAKLIDDFIANVGETS